MSNSGVTVTSSPDETFGLGEELGTELTGGEIILLTGGLGAGKTLFTKGVISSTGFDIDEVTSPSFTLVNLYRTKLFDVYHIDLWRSEGEAAAFTVGLDEILENETSVVIIEWAERLGDFDFVGGKVYKIAISGDGDDARRISIDRLEQSRPSTV
jgi:tRNA threonylcarbamoyladenosine biosynthesis protein TsaE